MNGDYAIYINTSYALFGALLLWDFIAPRLRARRALKNVLRRAQRDNARRTA